MIKKNLLSLLLSVSFILLVNSESMSLPEDKLITETSIGKIKFGMTYKQAISILKNYRYKIEPTPFAGVYFYNENENLPFLALYLDINILENDPAYVRYKKLSDDSLLLDKFQNRKIINITTCHKGFKTKYGWGIGSKLIQLKKLYPDMVLAYNLHDEVDNLIIKQYPKFIIEISTTDNKLAGIYNMANYPLVENTKKFRNNSFINCIEIRK